MLWCNRRALLGGLGASLGAGLISSCGFSPVYGPNGAGRDLFGQIRAVDPVDKPGFDFVRYFEERLGVPAADYRFQLSYEIVLRDEELDITSGRAITRHHLLGELHWKLTHAHGGDVILRGTQTSFTAYSAGASGIAEITAREDARFRLIRIFVDQLVAHFLAMGAEIA